MISYYPPCLLPFLQRKAWRFHTPSPRLYLSWEDALWEIVPALRLRPDCTILLPDFYCLDVTHNIEAHGYRVAAYPLDTNFQIKDELLLTHVRRHHPSILILFHAVGITNHQTQSRRFFAALPQSCFVLEDAVHRLLDPQTVKLHNPRHFILDSLRKNVPLPGSFCYSDPVIGAQLPDPSGRDWRYRWGTLWLYIWYRLLLQAGYYLHNPDLVRRAHHHALRRHDDLVGDAHYGHPGWPWIPLLYRHVDFAKTAACKARQVATYLAALKPALATTTTCTFPRLAPGDWGHLHAFPLVVTLPAAKSLGKSLDLLNIWAKFPDAPWSQSRRVFFLPLGFHLTPTDQVEIIAAIKVWLRTQPRRPGTTKARTRGRRGHSSRAHSPSTPRRGRARSGASSRR